MQNIAHKRLQRITSERYYFSFLFFTLLLLLLMLYNAICNRRQIHLFYLLFLFMIFILFSLLFFFFISFANPTIEINFSDTFIQAYTLAFVSSSAYVNIHNYHGKWSLSRRFFIDYCFFISMAMFNFNSRKKNHIF